MEQITAYKTSQGRIFETEHEARRHEFIMLMKFTSGALPSRRCESFCDALENLASEISSGIYPDAANRLAKAVEYFNEHRSTIEHTARRNRTESRQHNAERE
jgi:hypothetical protein